MQVDDDENGTQQPKQVDDYGIEVDFDRLDEDEREVCILHPFCEANHNQSLQDGSTEAAAQFDTAISKLSAEIERMAPNMKAVDRYSRSPHTN